jgi:hypothetical protein
VLRINAGCDLNALRYPCSVMFTSEVETLKCLVFLRFVLVAYFDGLDNWIGRLGLGSTTKPRIRIVGYTRLYDSNVYMTMFIHFQPNKDII